MSKDTITVSMNVNDIPIVVEALKKANEEIERLKEELKYTIPIVEHNKTIQSNINSYNKLAKYSSDLEDRIDKAIEYIEKWQSFPHTNGTTHEELRNLKNILKGSE